MREAGSRGVGTQAVGLRSSQARARRSRVSACRPACRCRRRRPRRTGTRARGVQVVRREPPPPPSGEREVLLETVAQKVLDEHRQWVPPGSAERPRLNTKRAREESGSPGLRDEDEGCSAANGGACVLDILATRAVEESRAVGRSDEVVTLQQCKHLDRATHTLQCHEALTVRAHKRGYLMVVCGHNHQWVWCAHCCDCGLSTRGCIMPAHWMQRDAYDTGKRNHMQQHNETANKRFKIKEQQRRTNLKANNLVADKGFAYFSAVGTVTVSPSTGTPVSAAASGERYLGAPVLAAGKRMPSSVMRASPPRDASVQMLLHADSAELAHGAVDGGLGFYSTSAQASRDPDLL